MHDRQHDDLGAKDAIEDGVGKAMETEPSDLAMHSLERVSMIS